MVMRFGFLAKKRKLLNVINKKNDTYLIYYLIIKEYIKS